MNGTIGPVQRTGNDNELALVNATGNGTAPGDAQVLTNLAAGAVNSTSTEAINGSQLFGVSNNTSMYLGGGADVQNGTAPNYYIQGDSYNSVGDALTTLDTNLTNLTGNVMNGTIGPVQRTGNPDELALVNATGNGTDPGTAQVLTNLANGAVTPTSRDAINGSQLFAVTSNTSSYLGGGADVLNGTAPTYVIQGSPYNDVGSALGAVDDNFNMTNANVTNVTNSVANLNNNLNNGTIGTVQRLDSGTLALMAPGGSAASPGDAQVLTNVANGSVQSGSKDAINGGQLWDVTQSIDNLTLFGTKYFHTNSTLADSVASGLDSTAIGPQAISSGASSIAMGSSANASGAKSVAVGPGAQASQDNALALGANAQAMANVGDVALGAGSTTAPVVATPTMTVAGTTYNVAGANPTSTVSVGSPGNERTITNVAAGQVSETSTDAINGSQLYATNQAVAAVNNSAVKYDTDGNGNTLNSVTFKGGNPGAPVTLNNVAPGAIAPGSTQAVNGDQLFQTNYRMDSFAQQVSKQFHRVDGGIAGTAALGMIRYDDRPGKFTTGVAGATYNGMGAVAFGAGYTSENRKWRFSAGANVPLDASSPQVVVGASVSYTWN